MAIEIERVYATPEITTKRPITAANNWGGDRWGQSLGAAIAQVVAPRSPDEQRVGTVPTPIVARCVRGAAVSGWLRAAISITVKPTIGDDRLVSSQKTCHHKLRLLGLSSYRSQSRTQSLSSK